MVRVLQFMGVLASVAAGTGLNYLVKTMSAASPHPTRSQAPPVCTYLYPFPGRLSPPRVSQFWQLQCSSPFHHPFLRSSQLSWSLMF